MNEINEEIKQTINLMQADIDDGAHGELQGHLYSLLEMKRNELQQRLVERSWLDPVTHDQEPIKSGKIADKAKPLTSEELKSGSWCVDVNEECMNALVEKGLVELYDWSIVEGNKYCSMAGSIVVMTPMMAHNAALKQIHLVGNEFYWGEK